MATIGTQTVECHEVAPTGSPVPDRTFSVLYHGGWPLSAGTLYSNVYVAQCYNIFIINGDLELIEFLHHIVYNNKTSSSFICILLGKTESAAKI